MRIAVLGVGGVGGYFGGMLAHRGADVRLIARGEHLAAMRARGLTVRSGEKEYVVPAHHIMGSTDECGPVDVVLFCVKAYDTDQAARTLLPLMTPETVIISLQNGIDNEEKIARAVATGTVLGGVSYIFATIEAPGLVVETGGPDGPRKIIFGPLTPPTVKIEEKSLAIERLFQEHGIEAEYTREAVTALWKKFILISGLAGMTALTRLTIGEILAVGESRALFLEALRETAAVARARGVDIPDDYPQHILSRFDAAESDTRSSLFYDLTHQKPMELEALSGTVIRLGESLGIATPIHRMIYAVLLPYHLRHSRRRTTERISTT